MKKTKKTEQEILILKAKKLYALGFTTREIGKMKEINKSHAWVAEKVKKVDKNLTRKERGV